jgi:hypothetical protein
MYFITKRTGPTGKKFQLIADRMDAIFKMQKDLSKEIGFTKWRPGYFCFYGGFSAVVFQTPPDTKLWKKVNGDEWMPRMSSKAGKALQAKLSTCPKITPDEINACIGFDGHPFKTIGFSQNSKTHFGFVTSAKWDIKIPKDCKEVTETKYNSIFKIKKKDIEE